ncbi:hypothetical protein STEG23_000025 [Scotinomys teguina]
MVGSGWGTMCINESQNQMWTRSKNKHKGVKKFSREATSVSAASANSPEELSEGMTLASEAITLSYRPALLQTSSFLTSSVNIANRSH